MGVEKLVDRFVARAAVCLPFVLLPCAWAGTLPRADASDSLRNGQVSQRIANDHADCTSFFDAFFDRQMKELRIPGAVVAWVRGGVIRHAAGYGVANRESSAPVDYEQTVFRIASVSKVFTAIAVLQLADTGNLDLKADIGQYLPHMHVGRAELGPVTASQLLVHTGGFDERLLGYLARDPEIVADLGGYLKTWMPPRTRPAGGPASYSNHGYALLGYLVERRSEMPMHVYVQKHVFATLAMRRTAFLVPPVVPQITSDICPGYWSSGERVETLWSRPYPAGAMVTTGQDMARFLVAFLAAARGEPSETLPQSVVARMLQQHFSHSPGLPGYTLGLAEMSLFGVRALLKGGSAPGHSAVVVFFPEHDAGLFVALNRQEPQLWSRLLPELVKQQFPAAVTPLPSTVQLQHADRFTGEYRATRYARASFERVLSLAAHARVTLDTGKLRVTGPGIDLICEPSAQRLVFSAEPGQYVAFHEDHDGRIDQMYINVLGEHLALERVSFRERTNTVLFSVLGACLGLVFAGLFQVVAGVRRRMKYGAIRPTDGIAVPLLSVVLAAAIVATLAAAYGAAVPSSKFLYGPSPELWLALTGTNVIALFAVLMLVTAGRQLVARDVGPMRRVASGLLCSACLIITLFLVQFNLVGYRL